MNPETNSIYDSGVRNGAIAGVIRSPLRPIPTENNHKFEAERIRPSLTLREKEVLRHVCDGLTNQQIASKLTVSRETIKSELKRIFRKIGVANRTQAAVLLVKQGWI